MMANPTIWSENCLQKSIEYAARKLQIAKFKDLQVAAIKAVLRGQYIFVSLCTGYGKSAIFQAIPLCIDHLRCTTAEATPTS